MQNSSKTILNDIESISKIPAVAHILEIVCRTTGMGFSAVARVTSDTWTVCAVRDEINFGLAVGGELKLETTICNEIRQHKQAVIIDHVAEDPDFAHHHTPLMYGFQSYISVPIKLKNGDFFGTLCAIDPKPAKLKNPTVTGMFTMFADLIAFHLDALEELAKTERELKKEQEIAVLRDQFIAILGHDLRNPLNAISNSAQLLSRLNVDERTGRITKIIRDSSFRMNGLIENMLDFASGRLGEGITITKTPDEDLEKLLLQVVEELQAIWPSRAIKLNFNFDHPVHADGKRLAQLFSNLLANALNYSPSDSTVEITAFSNTEEFNLCVANKGKQIPAAAMERLFQPFSRGEVEPNQKGLGLGLYIASEIANAHDGTLDVSSTPEQTCFTLRLPSQNDHS
ncbi:GAF domain-containing sensor histidine kinase [Pedobacter sp. D749]|uniref:GAF domain-containing sensor histidine kinase n=1 Tax=Pedobacter sp. D749 TaxID=2856523 RepID=UPI001C58D462|nr:GAF domain-containing sensor histidine kinase [Pedobacter sp. D749]QXU44163.1 GAF domain-containing sensor histidine kinase [Pedobacter sp. D749]